ncbi:hypothetical protein AURDEDRAFT_160259 [Auricularia subglabra TFB-10046 SS5]|nr:hypothetical protein AURDEDRAFT_160259 [Auricularia subglabra TFB-10046 SS5]
MQFLFAASFVALVATSSASPTPLAGRGVAPEGNGHIDVAVNGKVFPPPNVLGQEFPQNVQVTCNSCFARGDMSISAGGQDLGHELTPTANFTSRFVQAANFDFTRNWVGFAMQGFSAHVELAVDLTPANSSNELVIHLLGVPLTIPVVAVPGLSVTFDPQIHGLVNVSEPVTFTHGFDLTVPAGSTLLIPVAHVDETIAVGFNETVITTTDFQSSSGDLAMNFELSFRPVFKLALELLGEELAFEAHADLPKLDVAVSQVTNASAACVSGSGAFPQLTKLETSIGMDLGVSFLDKEFVPLDFSTPLRSSAPVQCYEYDPRGKVLVAPGSLKNNEDKDGENAEVSASHASAALVVLSALVALFA